MKHWDARTAVGVLTVVSAVALDTGVLSAQAPAAQPPAAPARAGGEQWDITAARGKTRDIDFTTTEGTWMSTDITADGQWIYFDLLGHVYRMRIAGGDAEVLTQNSGVALNYQPRVSPDGKLVAFITDRRGMQNLWVMNADGSNPRAVATDNASNMAEPAWTPDGRFIIVRRSGGGNAEGGGGAGGLYMYHRDGGQGVQLVAGGVWPSVSKDGKFLYYHVNMSNVTTKDLSAGQLQLRRWSFETGEVVDITSGENVGAAAGRFSSGGGAAPEISPDGRWLAFARQIPDGVLDFKGHKYGPRSALWLRDLKTGTERLLMDPIEPIAISAGKVLGALPRYRWAADGQSLVLTQGGKIRRVAAATGAVTTIPFSAKVHRTISEMARKEFRISDGPVEAQFVRWPSATVDGKKIVFQALGHIYAQDGTAGAPKRLTPDAFKPLEYAPAISPDGKWVTFVTFDDAARGNLYKVAITGGAPVKLNREPGDYVDPVWTPDGAQVVVGLGEGATARGRTITHNAWYDLVRFNAAGNDTGITVASAIKPTGAAQGNEARRQLLRPSFGPEGRLFYPEQRANRPGTPGSGGVALMSVKLDGSDKRTHLTFPAADEIVPSPDGQWVAFQEGDNVYVTAMAWGGTGGDAERIEKRRGIFPVTQLSRDGGIFPRWRDAKSLEWGSAKQYFSHNVDTKKTDTVTLTVSGARGAVAKGTVAITGARILTMNKRQVIDRGTIVIKDGRITCVAADCSTAGAGKVVDAAGKTIIPGWVDMHAHHYREWRGMRPPHDFEQSIYLAYGVTSSMDVSTWSQNVFPTGELIETGDMIGSRTFSTGDNVSRGDGARTNDITSYAIAQATVARLKSWGAVQIKQYAQPRRDQRQWLTDAARVAKLNVTSEGGTLFENLGMIMDGQTGWEHSHGEILMYSDVSTFLGKSEATYSPTLVVSGPSSWNIEYWFAERDWWTDAKIRTWFPWRSLISPLRVRQLRPKTDYSYPIISQAMADVIKAGGYSALGSHGELHGLAAHWEVWMGEPGLGAHGALEVASLQSARFLGADKDLGSLEVGKLADLIVLNSNPLEKIQNTLDMKWVMKGGVLYDAMSLDEEWPVARKYGPKYWMSEENLQQNEKKSTQHDR
jgi:Tol biopolymer transport system component